MSQKILIIGTGRQAKKLGDVLKLDGSMDITTVSDCASAHDTARVLMPDVVLLDAAVCEDAVTLAARMIEDRPVPIVMLSSYDQIQLVMGADAVGVSAHLFKPITRENLLGAINLGISRFRQCQLLREEIGVCREALRIRKIVERAKGILMKRGALTEEEAFLRLQKLSRDRNVKMEKVAESIITASEIM